MNLLEPALFLKPLAAALIAGALCAFLGVYIHLKRIIFVSIALSEVAALGVAAGLFLGLQPEVCACVLAVVMALLLGLTIIRGVFTREAFLGLTYCLAAAGAVILLAANPMAEAHGLDLVSGNLLYTSSTEILTLFVLAGVVFLAHGFLMRDLLFVFFDPETARTLHLPVRFYEFVIYFSLGLSIAQVMRSAGVLFVFSSMVIPPMIGLALTRSVRGVFTGSILSALVASGLGLWLSFRQDLPTGPAIVCIQGLLFFLALGFYGYRKAR